MTRSRHLILTAIRKAVDHELKMDPRVIKNGLTTDGAARILDAMNIAQMETVVSTSEQDWQNWKPRQSAAQLIALHDLEDDDPKTAALIYAQLHVGDQIGRIADQVYRFSR